MIVEHDRYRRALRALRDLDVTGADRNEVVSRVARCVREALNEDFPRGGVAEWQEQVGSGADHQNAGAEPGAAAGEDIGRCLDRS